MLTCDVRATPHKEHMGCPGVQRVPPSVDNEPHLILESSRIISFTVLKTPLKGSRA